MFVVGGRGTTTDQQAQLENLLTISTHSRYSLLERLRTGPVRASAPSLIQALLRLQDVRDFGIVLPATLHIPPNRIAALARFAATAKVTAITRLPAARRLATLIAFMHCLEAAAHMMMCWMY